jgi:DNA-binding IclR family transcriptional regulator
MPSHRLSTRAQRFLAQDVQSVMQLELVLALHRDADTPWTPDALARELRAPADWVLDQLTGLTSAGIARREDDGSAYRLDPAGAASRGIDEIAVLYPQRRTSIIKLIFARATG